MKAIVLGVFLEILLHVSSADYLIGSSCRDSKTNNPGVCRLPKSCPSIAERIKIGQFPTICGFNQKTPIVCCEDALPNTLAQPEHGFDTPSVSERKCQEYSNLTVESFNFLPLLVQPKPTTVFYTKCDKGGIPLVVGGKAAAPGEFPFMCAIGYEDGDWKCGGTLISEDFVMTAAHCARTRSFGQPSKVRIGVLNLKDPEEIPADVDVAQVIIHPDYSFSHKNNDIALLKLKNKVAFTKFVRPACLWTKFGVDHTKAIATGWGATSFAGDSSQNSLQRVTLDILPNSKCNSVYSAGPNIQVTNKMICSGVLQGNKDTCQGDSGGPLVVPKKGNNCVFYVVGVTSFGRSCGLANIPAIYTRVSEYIPWIEKTVWPTSF